VKYTIHLYPIPRLRMSGAIPALPLCAFMVWKETTLPVLFTGTNVVRNGWIGKDHYFI
jgi:hypothetical protein